MTSFSLNFIHKSNNIYLLSTRCQILLPLKMWKWFLYDFLTVIVENSMYSGHNKTTTVFAKKSEATVTRKLTKDPSSSTRDTVLAGPVTTVYQACDSTVKDTDCKIEKRKIFSCDFEGCNKKYTKLSHLKV